MERSAFREAHTEASSELAGRATMRGRYPGSGVHALQGGGHFPYVTRAEQYNAIIAEHLLGGG